MFTTNITNDTEKGVWRERGRGQEKFFRVPMSHWKRYYEPARLPLGVTDTITVISALQNDQLEFIEYESVAQ